MGAHQHHIETRTTKEFIPSWNKHTTCLFWWPDHLARSKFDFSPLRALAHSPHLNCYLLCFLYQLSCYYPVLIHPYFLPSLILFPTCSHIPCASQFPTRLPSHNHTTSTALGSEYPSKLLTFKSPIAVNIFPKTRCMVHLKVTSHSVLSVHFLRDLAV